MYLNKLSSWLVVRRISQKQRLFNVKSQVLSLNKKETYKVYIQGFYLRYFKDDPYTLLLSEFLQFLFRSNQETNIHCVVVV